METAEALADHVASDTTLRTRRNEWVAAGVFDALVTQAVEGYERIIGLDLRDVCLDGSQHKAPLTLSADASRKATSAGEPISTATAFCPESPSDPVFL